MQFSAAIVGLMAGLMAPPAVLDLRQSSLTAGATSPEAEIGRKISSLFISLFSITIPAHVQIVSINISHSQ